MKRILFVDDERIYSRLYVKAMESKGFLVSYCASPKSARKIVLEEAFDLFVVDLMMPSGGAFDKNVTRGDLITGACLAKELAGFYRDVPTIVFTAHHDSFIIDEVKSQLQECDKVFVLRKGMLNPDELANAVMELFYPKPKTSQLKKFIDCIILQPNVFGLGIDLQVLRKMFIKSK